MVRKTDLRGKKSLLVYCYSNRPNFSTHENTTCWLLQLLQIKLRRVKFLIKFAFPYLRIRAEFSKLLRKVSLNKGMLNCKAFIPTLSKLTCTCRHVLLWSHASQTYLSTQTLIRSSGSFHLTVIARMSFLVPADISFSLSCPIQTKPSTRTFSYHRNRPHKITCPYKQTFTFLCCSLHRPTRPQGHFLFTEISHTSLLSQTDAF